MNNLLTDTENQIIEKLSIHKERIKKFIEFNLCYLDTKYIDLVRKLIPNIEYNEVEPDLNEIKEELEYVRRLLIDFKKMEHKHKKELTEEKRLLFYRKFFDGNPPMYNITSDNGLCFSIVLNLDIQTTNKNDPENFEKAPIVFRNTGNCLIKENFPFAQDVLNFFEKIVLLQRDEEFKKQLDSIRHTNQSFDELISYRNSDRNNERKNIFNQLINDLDMTNDTNKLFVDKCRDLFRYIN